MNNKKAAITSSRITNNLKNQTLPMSSLDMTPLNNLIGAGIEPQALAKILDEVLFDYSYRSVQHCDEIDVKKVNTNMHYLRELRDAITQIAVKHK